LPRVLPFSLPFRASASVPAVAFLLALRLFSPDGSFSVGWALAPAPPWRCPVCSSSRSSLAPVVPPVLAPSPRAVLVAAFRSGGLVAFRVRSSSGSPSGFVVVVRFSSFLAAAGFGRAAAVRWGFPLRLRAGSFAVSVPCGFWWALAPALVGRVFSGWPGGFVGFWRAVAPFGGFGLGGF
jgi:hypothetical protein